jgi:hypothetical protein
MFFEYRSFSELMHDFSFSWEFISAVVFVLLIRALLAFVGNLARGVWGAIILSAPVAFPYSFRENISVSWLPH